MNKILMRFRFVNVRNEFVDMLDLRKTTRDHRRALMLNKEQVENCLKLYPELRSFQLQEVIPEKQKVLR